LITVSAALDRASGAAHQVAGPRDAPTRRRSTPSDPRRSELSRPIGDLHRGTAAGSDPKHLGAEIGFLAVLHTGGKTSCIIRTFTASCLGMRAQSSMRHAEIETWSRWALPAGVARAKRCAQVGRGRLAAARPRRAEEGSPHDLFKTAVSSSKRHETGLVRNEANPHLSQ
jgi:hypothetical protein